MITRREIAVSLHAAWRLFLRDASAIEQFDDSIAGVIKSFYCAVVVLPGYALLVSLSGTPQTSDVALIPLIVVNFIAYVTGWAAWPLIMHYVAPLIGRDDAYCRYIVAYNWANGPNILIALLFNVPAVLGINLPEFQNVLAMIAMAIMLLYHLFIVRIALRMRPLGAIGLVFAEYFLGYLILTLRYAALL